MTCQSCTFAARISFSKAETGSGGASGSSAPVQTSTLGFTLFTSAGILVDSTVTGDFEFKPIPFAAYHPPSKGLTASLAGRGRDRPQRGGRSLNEQGS